jgi:hypothetical protein
MGRNDSGYGLRTVLPSHEEARFQKRIKEKPRRNLKEEARKLFRASKEPRISKSRRVPYHVGLHHLAKYVASGIVEKQTSKKQVSKPNLQRNKPQTNLKNAARKLLRAPGKPRKRAARRGHALKASSFKERGLQGSGTSPGRDTRQMSTRPSRQRAGQDVLEATYSPSIAHL